MKYFTIEELIYSDMAKAKGIVNVPGEKEIENLKALVYNVLDPLRQAYGKPIRINSGYRSLALNRDVGGAATSSHMKGEAADITAGSKEENKKLFELAKAHNISFDQLIDEKNFSWIHISYREGNNRRHAFKL